VSWTSIRALLIWIAAAGLTTEAYGQTVEWSSIQLSVLAGAEREHFLAAHNDARKAVGVDPVDWSDEIANDALASLAQQKEALLDAAKEGWKKGQAVLPQHRADSAYGENIAGWIGTRPPRADWAARLWLQEKDDFDKLNAIAPYRVGDEKGHYEEDAERGGRPLIVGHYTAIIWKATRQIGAAKLVFDLTDEQGNRRSYMAILCNYSPPGNWQGQKPL
jgi:hypothetical protein